MTRRPRLSGIAVLVLRFAVIAPICLFVWWLILPAYAWVLGQVSGMALIHLRGVPIDAMRVVTDPEGVLNAKTGLTYYTNSGQREIAIVYLVSNLPSFLILVLATPGLHLRRRIRALSIGLSVLAVGHVVFIVMAFTMTGLENGAPQAAGTFLLTLPFLLWLALVYWEELSGLIGPPPHNGA